MSEASLLLLLVMSVHFLKKEKHFHLHYTSIVLKTSFSYMGSFFCSIELNLIEKCCSPFIDLLFTLVIDIIS